VAAAVLLAEPKLSRKKRKLRRKRKLRWTLEAVWICSEEMEVRAVATTKSSNKSRTCLILQMTTVFVDLLCLL
jgi:hypothetical protein